MNNIFWAGDSTVQTNKYDTFPQTGIGQVFHLFLKEEYQVQNHAKNGRSTKSFIDEGRLAIIEEQIGEGDYLFIQFGHNDEKIEDPKRYTEPYTSFEENLEAFILVARKQGAIPVLITPLERRCFISDKKLGIGEHTDYVAGMKQVAEKNNVALVDLYTMSRKALKKEGSVGSRAWYMNFDEGSYINNVSKSEDNTHLRYDGAVLFAGLIAKGLFELGDELKKIIQFHV